MGMSRGSKSESHTRFADLGSGPRMSVQSRPLSSDDQDAMPALRRTALAGELAALNGRLVDLLLKNAPAAELKAVQDEVRQLLDELEEEVNQERAKTAGSP